VRRFAGRGGPVGGNAVDDGHVDDVLRAVRERFRGRQPVIQHADAVEDDEPGPNSGHLVGLDAFAAGEEGVG